MAISLRKFPVEYKSKLRLGIKNRSREIQNNQNNKNFDITILYVFCQWGSIQRKILRRFYVSDIFFNLYCGLIQLQ